MTSEQLLHPTKCDPHSRSTSVISYLPPQRHPSVHIPAPDPSPSEQSKCSSETTSAGRGPVRLNSPCASYAVRSVAEESVKKASWSNPKSVNCSGLWVWCLILSGCKRRSARRYAAFIVSRE